MTRRSNLLLALERLAMTHPSKGVAEALVRVARYFPLPGDLARKSSLLDDHPGPICPECNHECELGAESCAACSLGE